MPTSLFWPDNDKEEGEMGGCWRRGGLVLMLLTGLSGRPCPAEATPQAVPDAGGQEAPGPAPEAGSAEPAADGDEASEAAAVPPLIVDGEVVDENWLWLRAARLADPRLRVANRAQRQLARAGERGAAAALPLLADDDPETVRFAVRVVREVRHLPHLRRLVPLLLHREPDVRYEAGLALRDIFGVELGFHQDAAEHRRREAAERWRTWVAERIAAWEEARRRAAQAAATDDEAADRPAADQDKASDEAASDDPAEEPSEASGVEAVPAL
jgi:hypothetical protein